MKNLISILILLFFLFTCNSPSEKKSIIQKDTTQFNKSIDANLRNQVADPSKYLETKQLPPYDTLNYGYTDEVKILKGTNCIQKFDPQLIKIIRSDSCNILLNVHGNYKIKLPLKFKISPKNRSSIKTMVEGSEVIIKISGKYQLLTKEYLTDKYNVKNLQEKYSYHKIYYDFEHPILEGGGDTDSYYESYRCTDSKNYISKNQLNVAKCRGMLIREIFPENGGGTETEISDAWIYSVNLSTGDYLSTIQFNCISPVKKNHESIIEEIIDSISFITKDDAFIYYADSIIPFPFDYFRNLRKATRATHYALGFSKEIKQPKVIIYELCNQKFQEDTAIYIGEFIDTTVFYKYKGTKEKYNFIDGRNYHYLGKPQNKNYYTNSGYVLGQLAPPEHFCWSYTSLVETYLMYNVVPMLPEFKEGLWNASNQQILRWLEKYEHLFVISAISEETDHLVKTINIQAPINFVRIVINISEKKIIGILLPHESTDDIKGIKDYVYPIDSLIKVAPEIESYLNVFPYSIFSHFDSNELFEYWFNQK